MPISWQTDARCSTFRGLRFVHKLSTTKHHCLPQPLDATAPWLQVDERLQANNGRVKVGSDLEMLARDGEACCTLSIFFAP